MSITIDKEFESLIPPLSPEEFQQLEENCVKEGIRDALITWNGILIDGHNRFKIAAVNYSRALRKQRGNARDRFGHYLRGGRPLRKTHGKDWSMTTHRREDI